MNEHATSPDLGFVIREIAQGKVEAFRRLYDIEAGRMLGISIRILRRRALAEEAVHDAFLNVWNHAGSYDARHGHPRAWLHTIVRNRALNILRGEARTELSGEIDRFDAPSEDESPEEAAARLSDADQLRHCLGSLDERPRRAVVLAYTHGLSHGEIAERLETPLGTIKSQIRRALIALKECLG